MKRQRFRCTFSYGFRRPPKSSFWPKLLVRDLSVANSLQKGFLEGAMLQVPESNLGLISVPHAFSDTVLQHIGGAGRASQKFFILDNGNCDLSTGPLI